MKLIDSIHNIYRNEYFPNTVTYLNHIYIFVFIEYIKLYSCLLYFMKGSQEGS